MFCNKCGKEISDQVRFCPACGQECAPQKEMPAFQSYVNTGNLNQKAETSKESFKEKKRLLQIVGIAAMALLAIILAVILVRHFVLHGGSGKDYSIVGEWNSEDLMDVGEIFKSALVNKAGLSEEMAEAAVELIGITGNMEELSLTFTEGGNIYLSFHGIGAGLGNMTYELLSDTKVSLQYSLDAAVFGLNIPINLSYTGKYKVGKDNMSLDFFGYEAKFVRASDADDF